MKPTYFISDAHLGGKNHSAEEQQEKLLLDFLGYVGQQGETLFILGDLFDFWFEYRSVIPRRYFKVLFALKALIDQEVEIHYITGNHDFWMDTFFPEDLHIQIHDKPLDIQIEGKRFHIAHGDGLAKRDVKYRMFKKILRHPFHIRLYRILHPDLGFAFADFCSRLSRNHRKIEDRDAEYINYAKIRFQEGFDGVILGHTHSPQEYRESNKTYINTGDWMSHFTYGKLEKGRLSLEHWPLKNISLYP
ncbi:UDP-2,3-diacylglucosamine diphosphatase [bacterium]|nr:UDP-2,3-diacylglucosamine diphosphatase [bacterium]